MDSMWYIDETPLYNKYMPIKIKNRKRNVNCSVMPYPTVPPPSFTRLFRSGNSKSTANKWKVTWRGRMDVPCDPYRHI
jgi:hypothetical protein